METNTLEIDEVFRTLTQAVEAASRAIPPVWPLASSVAVNPFLGQAGESLETAGARLARVAGVLRDDAARLVPGAHRFRRH